MKSVKRLLVFATGLCFMTSPALCQTSNSQKFCIEPNICFNSSLVFNKANVPGQTVFAAETSIETALITQAKSKKHHNSNFEQLDKWYDDVVKGMLKSRAGLTLISQMPLEIDSLICRQIVFNLPTDAGIARGMTIVVSIREMTVSFQLLYLESDEDSLELSFSDIITGIEFIGLTKDDQIDRMSKYNWESIGELTGSLIIFLVLGYAFISAYRKGKSKHTN